MTRAARRPIVLALALLIAALGAGVLRAAEAPHFSGRALIDVLEEFRAQGLLVVYSSDVVRPDVRVAVEPEAAQAEIMLAEILLSVGLALERRGDILLVVPGKSPPASAQSAPGEAPRISAPKLENVVVHASRYAVVERDTNTYTLLGDSDIDQLVGAGREPLRAIGRLPGAATAGLSSKQNIRGGEEDEVLLVFDGLPLFEPFHLKDFQNLFSILDPRVVGGMEVYTGGFPAQYGDRLSGVIDVVPQAPAERPHHEVGIDFFNVGFLSSGGYAGGQGDWLVSARRGTMDLIFDFTNQDIGDPSYYDLLAQLRRRIDDAMRVSASVMYADDKITLNETDFETAAKADYRTLHAWVSLDHELTDALSYRAVGAWVESDNLRQGEVDRPDESLGDVYDKRRYTSLLLKQDWRYAPSEQFLARWGVDLRDVSASYRYRSDLAFFEDDLLSQLVGRTGRDLDLSVAPDGTQVGLYLSNRWRFTPRWTAEVGLRWDRQSYIDGVDNEQTSPRLSFMYQPGEHTRLRFGWGRFSQAQGVNELQVEDGVTQFFPAQRSYHSVLGLDHRFPNDLMLRVELYRKNMDDLRPRYENLFDQLELLPELSPDRVVIAPDSATAHGVEALLRSDAPDAALNWWIGASFSRVEDSFGGADVPRSWDQRQAYNAGLNWRHGTWRADLVAHFHSGWPTTEVVLVADDGENVAVLGPRNASRLSDFFSVDFRVTRRKPLAGNRALTLFLELTNLTNHDNVCCVDYSLDEDANGDEFLQRERDHWLPVVPSIGVIYEF